MKLSDKSIKAINDIVPKKEQQAFLNLVISKGLEEYKAEHADMVEVFIDGGSRGNPGSSGGGFGVFANGKLIHEGSEYFGNQTNNQAEYLALRLALREIYDKFGSIKIHCYMDSKLVVEQMNGNYKVKSKNVRPLFDDVSKIAEQFAEFKIKHVMREQNQLADKLANEAMDQRRTSAT